MVCIANSRKISGRCLAGKERIEHGFGEWIRPVSQRPAGEISEFERRYQNGDDPNVLDIIEIPLLHPHPHNYQTENYLIDARHAWRKVGQFDKHQLHILADTIEGDLWINGYSSYNGINDRIPEDIANTLCNSLYFVHLEQLSILVCTEGAEFGNAKRRIRAEFSLHDTPYKLAVTDPRIERAFLKKNDGKYPLWEDHIYVCISIGEPYSGYCYKLIASIIA